MPYRKEQKDDFNSKVTKFGQKLKKNEQKKSRKMKGKIILSAKARAMGRNEDAIRVNLDSVRNKVKFGRLVVYSVNCLANLGENRFNCDFIVEQGGIDALNQVIGLHKANPAVMKEASRLVSNIARASPEFADQLAKEGILEKCVAGISENAEETGTYSIESMNAILKNSKSPKKIADQIVNLGGTKVIQNALKKYPNNGDLAASLVSHLNELMNVNPKITNDLGKKMVFKDILQAMKNNPGNGQLAIAGAKALQKLAMANPKFLKQIQDANAVNILSKCMQEHPDLKELTEAGAKALKLLAQQNDITRAMVVLADFSKYDNIMITQALGLLGNLALIKENANFIVNKGGLDALMGLIAFKSKATKLSPQEVTVVANGIRAMGRLLENPKVTQQFINKSGIDMLKEMIEDYDEETEIVNACMDAMNYMSKNQPGKEVIMGEGAVETATRLLSKNPYGVTMQKYNDLLSELPLEQRPQFLQKLVNSGLLSALTKNLAENYEDPNTVSAIMDIMKQVVGVDPKLAQQLAKLNGQQIIRSIQAHEDNKPVLSKIFDTIHCMALADPKSLELLKNLGLEDMLVKMLKQENISDDTAAVVKNFYDQIKADDIDVDLTNVLLGLKGLGMPLEEISKTIQEAEIKQEEPKEDEIDVDGILNELNDLSNLFGDNPDEIKKYVVDGKVGHILDNIQQCYDNPTVVVAGLKALLSCATVPGIFPMLEEAGVMEGVIQCMLEHPNELAVQYGGVQVLAQLAMHGDSIINEALSQPITLETMVKATSENIKNAGVVGEFAKLVCALMNDKQNAPQISQQLASLKAMDVLKEGINAHVSNPGLVAMCNQALSSLNPYLVNPNILTGKHLANVAPFGTISLADLIAMPIPEIEEVMREYDTDTLMKTMRGARHPKMVQSAAKEINERLKGGDQDVYNSTVSGGGIGDLLGQGNANLDNPQVLAPCLDSIGTLSTDDRLKTLLGMHGTIKLILETMRRHPNDIELLDKCCYILANLSFNNAQNMTSIIELGGTTDIVNVVNKHTQCNFICESAINVLVNLCHNSDKNKTLICRSGGAKCTLKALKMHNKSTKHGDESVIVSSFRCLANLAFVNDNVKQLIKLDIVAVVMDTMNQNTDKKDIIQMGVVVLANLSSHERTAARMVHLGVLDLMIKVSEFYPDELEIQRSCLGCVGNLMNEQSNAISFMDKKGHKRVFEIMQELVFEESVVILAMKLLKVLATNADVATELTMAGAAKVCAQTMEENKSNEEIIALGCQTLCKLIVTVEAAKEISKQGVTELLVETAKENNNWANITVMIELVKVVVNICSVEENAQPFARNGSVCLLRAMEAHATNAVFLNNAAMALSKLSIHPASARPLVKRGAIAVILQSCKVNMSRKAILTRYIRTLTNLMYTEHKAGEELANLNGYAIIKEIAAQHVDYPQLQGEFKAFEKAVKLKSQPFMQKLSKNANNPRDKLAKEIIRMVTSGCLMKKYSDNKAKKKMVRCNDNLDLLLFEDPNGAKQPKQLGMKSVKNIIGGFNIADYSKQNNVKIQGMKYAKLDCCIAIFSLDPNGREFSMLLECPDQNECHRWVNGLQEIMKLL